MNANHMAYTETWHIGQFSEPLHLPFAGFKSEIFMSCDSRYIFFHLVLVPVYCHMHRVCTDVSNFIEFFPLRAVVVPYVDFILRLDNVLL